MITIYSIELYTLENGKSPIKEFLASLPPKIQAKALKDIDLLRNYGNALKEPYVKPIKGKENKGLWELRVKFSSDIVRIFYFTYYRNFVTIDVFRFTHTSALFHRAIFHLDYRLGNLPIAI